MRVYCLYEKGFRLDRASVLRSTPAVGELALIDRPDLPRQGVLIAQLMRGDKSYLLPVLDGAKVVRMTRRGLLIEGKEIIPPKGAKGYDTRYSQAWWCEPIT